MSKTITERNEAIERLRGWLKPGDTVFTVLRHRSVSGMSHNIDAYQITGKTRFNGEPVVTWLSPLVANATGLTFDRKRESLKVGGAGMDMGFHVVYSLSRTLFPDGFGCIGEHCPSNDHSNGDRLYTPHGQPSAENNGAPWEHWHQDGGYALRHRWI